MDFKKHVVNLPPAFNVSNAMQAARWFTKPLEFMEECYEKLGNAFMLDLGALGKHAFFCDPSLISILLKADATTYYTAKDKAFMAPLFGHYSLFTLDNQSHLQRRRSIAPIFHSNKIHHYGKVIRDITLQTLSTLPENKTIALQESMLKISLNIIFEVIFGFEEKSEDEYLKHLIEKLLKMSRAGAMEIRGSTQNLAMNNLQSQWINVKKELDSCIKKLIAARKKDQNDKKQDILTLLLTIKDEESRTLSTEEIKDHLVTLLIAGHETTATALTWAVYWIHTNPLILRKLREEISTIAADNLMNNASNNPYLLATCQETLRIMPIVAIIARALKTPLSCGDYLLPAGMNIAIPIYLLHRNPDIYPEPEQFRPERFLERKFQFNEYMPFGGGSRICIGMFFALYQMKIILAVFLTHFEIILDNTTVQPIRKSLVIAPAQGLYVKLRKC